MNAIWHRWRWAMVCVAVLGGVAVGYVLSQPRAVLAQPADASSPRYTVVHTEGTNLIITDNRANTLYFYTVDPGNEPGSDLKLRGSLDLSQVGKQVLTPKLLKKAQ